MANCCVAKQSHRTQAHPTPPAGISRPLNPSISQQRPQPPRHHSWMPLATATFFKLCCQQQSCHGWWCCLQVASPSLSSVAITLPPSLSYHLFLSLTLYYFWYFRSWAELLTRSFCVDCPHPLAGLWFEFVLSCSGKRQYEVLHNFYLYLPCCFCHVFFYCSRYCCCCCFLFGSVLAMFCTANSLLFSSCDFCCLSTDKVEFLIMWRPSVQLCRP